MSTTRAMVTTPPPDTPPWRHTSPLSRPATMAILRPGGRPPDTMTETGRETGHLCVRERSEGDTAVSGTTETGDTETPGGGGSAAERGTGSQRDTGGGEARGSGDTGRSETDTSTGGSGTERGAGRSRGRLRPPAPPLWSRTIMTARRRLGIRGWGQRRTGAGGASRGQEAGSGTTSPLPQEIPRRRILQR